jgi:hypothetical protein
MILTTAIIVGLVAGLIRSRWKKREYQPIQLNYTWLVFIGVIPQLAAFSIPFLGSRIPGAWVSPLLVSSLFLLLLFTWLNRKKPGFWILGVGLALNFIVIILNGGLMPLAPETVEWLVPGLSRDLWQIGERFGQGKDVVLAVSQTRLWFLGDQLRSPGFLPFRFAFSIGDCMIALGAFWLLWSLGGSKNKKARP